MVALLVSILTTLEFFKNPAYFYEANWKKVLSWRQLCTAFDDFKCMPHEEGVTYFTYG